MEAAKKFGFDAYQANLTFEELEELISQNIMPIVFVKFAENVNYLHAVVVYKTSSKTVFALDPENGERRLDVNQFIEIWSRGLTIIIESKK